MTDFKPHAYQARAIRFIERKPAASMWLDMGLGKTVVTLTAIQNLISSFRVSKVMVFAPIRVIENTWPDEAKKWIHIGLRLQVIRGTPKQREAQLNTEADVYLINYEQMGWLYQFRKRLPLDHDMIVFDESTMMKNPAAKRFKFFKHLFQKRRRTVLLTGTPAPQGYLDLFAQYYLLDRGERLEAFITHYRDKYFHQIDRDGFAWALKSKLHGQRIEKRIRDVTLTMKAEDYLKMPAIIHNDVKVTLTPKLMEDYRELEREMVLELNALDRVTALNAAVLTNKCRQFTAGAVYVEDDEGKRKTVHVHNLKLDALAEVVEETGGEPVLVAYEFQSDLAALRKRWPKARWIGGGQKPAEATRNINDWNRGAVPLMFVHPASVGHGINLQHGGRVLVWYTVPWSLEHYLQTEKRLHRQGQTKPVMVHHLVATGTVDDGVVLPAVKAKGRNQGKMIDALSDYVRRVSAS